MKRAAHREARGGFPFSLLLEPFHKRRSPNTTDQPTSDPFDPEKGISQMSQASPAPSPTTLPTQDDPNSTSDQNGGVRQRPSASTGKETTSSRGLDKDNNDKNNDKKKRSNRLFKPVTPKEPFTTGNQIRRTFFNSWLNVLLVFAPIGIALNYVSSVNRVVVFVVNFIAIIPLAAKLSFATEEIALRTGETLGGLLNATFGNAVELIVAIMALNQRKIVIVQTSLIGSILSNLLLVLGMCFFCGGLRRSEQFFNTTVAQTATSLLALAVASIIVPSVFDRTTGDIDVTGLSRGTSIILLIVYCGYLFFQLKTHHSIFSAESKKVPAKPLPFRHPSLDMHRALVGVGVANTVVNPPVVSFGSDMRDYLLTNPHRADEEEPEEPQLRFSVAVATLTISTVIIAFCAEFMVNSIDAVTKSGGLSQEFVGLILLPIVGNAAEHATAVTVAIKDKMDLAIGVAVGSSMQVSLFLIPLLVVIGWGMGISEMNLSFDIFQVAVLFVSVLLVNYLIADGKSHWLEGKLLICLYCIIAVCAWYYPSHETSI